MTEKENIQQELEQRAPLLASIRKGSGSRFSQPVPEGYFENLADQVLEKATTEKVSPLVVVQTARPNHRTAWLKVAAAVAVVVAVAAGFWYNGQSGAPGPVSLADLGKEETAAYITSNISDFELSLMQEADLFDEATVKNMDALPQLEEVPVEDYLEDFDYEDIEALF